MVKVIWKVHRRRSATIGIISDLQILKCTRSGIRSPFPVRMVKPNGGIETGLPVVIHSCSIGNQLYIGNVFGRADRLVNRGCIGIGENCTRSVDIKSIFHLVGIHQVLGNVQPISAIQQRLRGKPQRGVAPSGIGAYTPNDLRVIVCRHFANKSIFIRTVRVYAAGTVRIIGSRHIISQGIGISTYRIGIQLVNTSFHNPFCRCSSNTPFGIVFCLRNERRTIAA
ncbi:hypothetical protein D3C87_1488280 [compost metagenome]